VHQPLLENGVNVGLKSIEPTEIARFKSYFSG